MRHFSLSFLGSIAVAATLAACGGGGAAPSTAPASSAAAPASKPAAASTAASASASAKPAASGAAAASAKPAGSGAASAKPAASGSAGAAGSAAAKPAPSLAPATSVAQLKVQSTSLGNILADSRGMTLYTYDAEGTPASKDVTKCEAACLTPWPPLLSSDAPTAPAGVTGKLGVVARPEGATIKQVTYNDMPLYFFVQDQQPGDTKGQGSKGFGGNWQVVKVG